MGGRLVEIREEVPRFYSDLDKVAGEEAEVRAKLQFMVWGSRGSRGSRGSWLKMPVLQKVKNHISDFCII